MWNEDQPTLDRIDRLLDAVSIDEIFELSELTEREILLELVLGHRISLKYLEKEIFENVL